MNNYAMSESAAGQSGREDEDKCFICDLYQIVLDRLALYLCKSQNNANRYSAFAPNGQHVAEAEPAMSAGYALFV